MENDLLETFGLHLRKLRQERKMSQIDLAYKGGFDRNYIGMLERGERNPSLKNIKRIAQALEITLVELVNFE